MKNCTRLDVVSSNTITIEKNMNEVTKKKLQPTLKSSIGNKLSKKLGSNWTSIGTSAELSSTSGDVISTIKVGVDEKTKEYKFSVRFDTSCTNDATTSDISELKQNISDTLLALVKTTADLGNKLG